MSQLPGVATATVDDAKITHYLLDPTHRNNGGKAKFFESFGFSASNWAQLKQALLDHPQKNFVTSQINTGYGQKYTVSCSIISPNGRNPCIVSVWIIEPPDTSPRFVTAYANP